MKSEGRILARRYARALCSALKTEDLPPVIKEMGAISAAMDNTAAFYNPGVSTAAKKTALAGVTKNKILQNLLNVMADNKRLPLLGAVKDEAQNILNAAAGIVNAEITFANAPQNKTEIENILKKLFKAQKIAAVYKEDKSLIAGVKIKAEGLVIDGSVKNNLEKLKAVLEV